MARTDYYSVLGVGEDATFDEIARAFRANAKQLHPDTAEDPHAVEQFKELSAAYAVLSDQRSRRDYDASRPVGLRAAPAPAPAAPAKRKPWSRRRAWTSLIVGSLVALLGLGAAYITWHLHDVDATQRAHFIPVTARRLDDARHDIAFTTRDGQRVVTHEPEQHGDPTGLGPTVTVRYDPAHPEHVIVNTGTFGRDITLAIVALKLFVGGLVFAILGARRLKFARRL